MALVDSLLSAMVRADGDALVMHVGERPIVVSGPRTIDLSTHGMNLSAMVGMLGQLLSGEAMASLKELGAVEHALPSRGNDYFSVVAARSGDDIWIEIRRRRESSEGGAAISSGSSDAVAVATRADDRESSVAAPVSEAVVAAQEQPGHLPIDGAEAAGPLAEDVAAEPALEETTPAAAELVADEAEPTGEAAPLEEAEASKPGEPPSFVEQLAADEPPEIEAGEPAAALGRAASSDVDAEAPVAASEAEAVSGSEPRQEPEQPTAEPEAPVFVPHVTAMPELVASNADATPAVAPEPPAEAEAPGSEDDAFAEPVSVSPPEDTQTAALSAPAASLDTDLTAPLEEASPALPVMAASAGSSSSVLVSVTPVMPMEPVRQAGPPADEPPARPLTPPAAPPAPTGAENGASHPDAPFTRTVRIEVPPRAAAPSRSAGIERLLRAADAAGASELFLISQSRPYVRVGGNVRPLSDETPLLPGDAETLIADVTPEPWREAVRRGDPAEWLIEVGDVGRIRCSTFRDQRGPGANFHFAFLRATTADDLQLSADVRRLATEPDGLILVAGGPANDEAAMIAAFVDILNQQRADYIITLEPLIQVQYPNREALISQREVGRDPGWAATAARAALREGPDVLVIENIASGEMAQIAIEAAAQDRLVIASIDAPSGIGAVQRLIDLVPVEQRQAARAALARCFRGAVAQLLLRKSTGGRIAARELLSGTRSVARILADGDLAGLAEPLSSGSRGMAPLVDGLVEYVRSGVVDVREAVRKAPDRDLLMTRLQMAGVDLSGIETEG